MRGVNVRKQRMRIGDMPASLDVWEREAVSSFMARVVIIELSFVALALWVLV